MLPLFYPSLLITALFFLSSFEKIYRFPISTVKFAKKMKFPLTLAQLIIIAVIILEFTAPVTIAAYLYTGRPSLFPCFKLSIIALIIFTILATILYHNPFEGRDKFYAFISNVSTVGGLSALYVCAA
jgi:uncharacterized membrane protein YphA (DoxX/SURF4 family)